MLKEMKGQRVFQSGRKVFLLLIVRVRTSLSLLLMVLSYTFQMVQRRIDDLTGGNELEFSFLVILILYIV